jgi:hypothetical protein
MRSLALLLARVPLLLQLSPHADALMFHSNAVSKQWDTWVFVENGTFYVSCWRSR